MIAYICIRNKNNLKAMENDYIEQGNVEFKLVTEIVNGNVMDVSVFGSFTGTLVRACRFLLWKKLEERCLTKKELAYMCGVSQNTLSCYMSGKSSPTLEFICRAAVALRCEVTDLFVPTGWKWSTIEGRNRTLVLYDDVLDGLGRNGKTLHDVAKAAGVSMKAVKAMLRCDTEMDVNVAYFICTMSGIGMKRLRDCTMCGHLQDGIVNKCDDGFVVDAGLD